MKKGNLRRAFEIYGSEYEKSEAIIHTLGSVLTTPVIDDNTLYFGSSDGAFYAVQLPPE